MYNLTRSVWYNLVYGFCQTDTFGHLDMSVRQAHGVCGICATDWLNAKATGGSFIFSMQTVWQKARLINEASNLTEMYTLPLAPLQLGNVAQVPFTAAGGQTIAATLANHPYLILHLGAGLNGVSSTHALAVAKVDGKYYMFDSNFGEYKCSYAKGVATWWANIVTCIRADKPNGSKRYTDWASQADVLPFS